jgi:hypothetical protein
MGLGYDVDGEPTDHLPPQAEGVVVNHLLRPARTSVLEYCACHGSAETMSVHIMKGKER